MKYINVFHVFYYLPVDMLHYVAHTKISAVGMKFTLLRIVSEECIQVRVTVVGNEQYLSRNPGNTQAYSKNACGRRKYGFSVAPNVNGIVW